MEVIDGITEVLDIKPKNKPVDVPPPGPGLNTLEPAAAQDNVVIQWAAYDDKAVGTQLGDTLRRPLTERSEENKKKAISFATYRCLADLFPADVARYKAVMTELGFDPTDTRVDPKTPSGIGNLTASSVLKFRHHDGSNQLGDLHPGAYTDYTGYTPANDPDHVKNVDRWQPLRTPVPDGGLYGRFLVQTFTTAQWGLVTPFAMESGSQFRPKKKPASFVHHKKEYVRQAKELLELSGDLTDKQK